ncbi:ankyrin repeat-containing domain protein [Aspergillus crustosus]
MSLQILPAELTYDILSRVTPSWRWGRQVRWERNRQRVVAEEHVRWFLNLRLVSPTFNDLVIDHVLVALRAGKMREVPLRRGPPTPSTIGFVERLLRSLVVRTAPFTGNANADGDLSLSAGFLARRKSSSPAGDVRRDEKVNNLRDIYTAALISTLPTIIGPSLVLDMLKPSQDLVDMFGSMNDDKQQWRIAGLMAAAYLGRITDIERLLSLGVDINSDPRDRWLYPPIMAAAIAGRVDVLEFLASHGADLHELTVGNGDNAVHFAALAGDAGVVERLLGHGVDCDVVNNEGVTPLYRAASAGHADVVRALFAAKPEGLRSGVKDSLGRAAIHWAVERGYGDVVQEFLSHKDTDIDIEDAGEIRIKKVEIRGYAGHFLFSGYALALAAEEGSEDALRFLLSCDDAESNWIPDDWPSQPTVLDGAIRSNKIGHVRAVLDQPRLDMEIILAKHPVRPSRLHIAAQQDGIDPAIVAALLAHPSVDVNARDMYKRTPLHYAASTGQIEMVKVLLAQPGIDASAPTTQGQTPLCEAAQAGQPATVTIMLDDPRAVDWARILNTASPLTSTAFAGSIEITRMLLELKY